MSNYAVRRSILPSKPLEGACLYSYIPPSISRPFSPFSDVRLLYKEKGTAYKPCHEKKDKCLTKKHDMTISYCIY